MDRATAEDGRSSTATEDGEVGLHPIRLGRRNSGPRAEGRGQKNEKGVRGGVTDSPEGGRRNKGLHENELGGSGKDKKSAFAPQVGRAYAVNAATVWNEMIRRRENVDIGMGLANNPRRLL